MSKKLSLLSLLAAAALAVPQVAAAGWSDVTYLVCTRGPQGTNDGSIVARVTLDPVTSRGNLDPVMLLAEYDHVDAAAVTPDGRYMYFVDAYASPSPQRLGVLDLLQLTYTGVGTVSISGGPAIEVDQLAFALDGTLLMTNTLDDSLYAVNMATAEATLIGVLKTPSGTTVNVYGGDILVSETGVLYMWTNGSRADAPAGLYRAVQPPVAGQDVVMEFLGSGNDGNHLFTGAAFYADGSIIGSNGSYQFHTQNPVDGSDLAIYWMYAGGAPFYGHNFGDMANGPMPEQSCNRTIGYWKNHSWDGAVVYVNGVTVDEALGQSILWNAKGNNWSMFFAQLIAAKLNCPTCSVVLEADAFLATQNVTSWYQAFANGAQKAAANAHKDALDAFNNSNHCD